MESGDAMSEVGTLKELGVQVGDVVYVHYADNNYTVDENPFREQGKVFTTTGFHRDYRMATVISRSTPPLRTWAELNPAEKGALLLAHHQGEVIEWSYKLPWETQYDTNTGSIAWSGQCYYRIKPQPKIDTVDLFIRDQAHDIACKKIGTVMLIDGKPDCASVKMEEV